MKAMILLSMLISMNVNASDLNVLSNMSLKAKSGTVNLAPGAYNIEGLVKSNAVEIKIDGKVVTFKKGANSTWPKNKNGQIYIPAKDSKQSVDFNSNYSDVRTSVGPIKIEQRSCTFWDHGQQCGGNGAGGTICWPVSYPRPGRQTVRTQLENRTESLNAELTVGSLKVATINHVRPYSVQNVLYVGFCF